MSYIIVCVFLLFIKITIDGKTADVWTDNVYQRKDLWRSYAKIHLSQMVSMQMRQNALRIERKKEEKLPELAKLFKTKSI